MHDTLFAHFQRHGWRPVRWSHHPEHIKDAIRSVGFRLRAKTCYANAQRLVNEQDTTILRYVEGVVRVGKHIILHAWVADESGPTTT